MVGRVGGAVSRWGSSTVMQCVQNRCEPDWTSPLTNYKRRGRRDEKREKAYIQDVVASISMRRQCSEIRDHISEVGWGKGGVGEGSGNPHPAGRKRGDEPFLPPSFPHDRGMDV